GRDGLCHISELDDKYVGKVEDVCKVGDVLQVKVIAIDDHDRVKLSRKALIREAAGLPPAPPAPPRGRGDGEGRRREGGDREGGGRRREGGEREGGRRREGEGETARRREGGGGEGEGR